MTIHWVRLVRWPLAVLIIVIVFFCMFRQQIARAIDQMTKGQMSISKNGRLTLEMDRLTTDVAKASSQVGQAQSDDGQTEELNNTIRSVLKDAATSPKVALMRLSFEIQNKARKILAETHWSEGHLDWSLDQSFQRLTELGEVPRYVASSLTSFEAVRSQILREGNSVPDSLILGAIDSGAVLLKVLYSIPVEKETVLFTSVPIYFDSAGMKPILDAKGIILEATSPGGTQKTVRIFPTTRTGYVKGEVVSWDWNTSKQWGQAWYRDPETKQIKEAWWGSMDFVGRDVSKLDKP